MVYGQFGKAKNRFGTNNRGNSLAFPEGQPIHITVEGAVGVQYPDKKTTPSLAFCRMLKFKACFHVKQERSTSRVRVIQLFPFRAISFDSLYRFAKGFTHDMLI